MHCLQLKMLTVIGVVAHNKVERDSRKKTVPVKGSHRGRSVEAVMVWVQQWPTLVPLAVGSSNPPAIIIIVVLRVAS